MPAAAPLTAVAMSEITVSTPAGKVLKSKVTGKPATRPDGKNLFVAIDIDLKKAIAMFHCQNEEHVRDHRPRWVTFRADQDCVLTFSDVTVFNRKTAQLSANMDTVLPVNENPGTLSESETLHDLYSMTPEREGVVKTQKTATALSLRPPVIVVP